MKKLRNFLLFIGIIFLFFLIFSVIPKNYTFKYKINNISVQETYDKKNKSYLFIITEKSNTFKYSFVSKYHNERGLIKKINIKNNCVTASLNNKKQFSVCIKDNEYQTAYANDSSNNKQIDVFNNIKIYNLLDRKYFVWNYHGFATLEKEKYNELKLFDNDIYELGIITKIKDYLLLADYDQKYHFDRMYLIQMKNNKIEKVKLDREIYFNSYVLGTNKKDVYIYDLQKELQYKVNPFKQTVEKNKYEVLINNEWNKISINKLNKGNVKFYEDYTYGYFLNENKLYYKTLNSNILITNLDVSRIVESNDKEAFFISGDTFYYNNFDNGTTRLMSYSEWNFNNKNIYVF